MQQTLSDLNWIFIWRRNEKEIFQDVEFTLNLSGSVYINCNVIIRNLVWLLLLLDLTYLCFVMDEMFFFLKKSSEFRAYLMIVEMTQWVCKALDLASE